MEKYALNCVASQIDFARADNDSLDFTDHGSDIKGADE